MTETWTCPDCDEHAEEEQDMFLHRIRKHTDADTSGGSFNVYHPEIWQIFMEMAVTEAARRSPEGNPTRDQIIIELEEMGLSVHHEDMLPED